MSDDNILNFNKILDQTKSNKDETLKDRFMNCIAKEGKCKCQYCNYSKHAAEMIVEFLAEDIWNYQKKTGAVFSTFDLKDILFKAIYEVKEFEKKMLEEEKDPEDKK